MDIAGIPVVADRKYSRNMEEIRIRGIDRRILNESARSRVLYVERYNRVYVRRTRTGLRNITWMAGARKRLAF